MPGDAIFRPQKFVFGRGASQDQDSLLVKRRNYNHSPITSPPPGNPTGALPWTPIGALVAPIPWPNGPMKFGLTGWTKFPD